MGSSSKAGTRGIPSTPRAGAPIEMVAILKHCVSAYQKLHQEGKFSHEGVKFKKRDISYGRWAEIISDHFEQRFYIPTKEQEKNQSNPRHSSIQEKYIKLRGIYKDVV